MRSTHGTGNILELLFSNNSGFLHSYQCLKTAHFGHYIIECKTTFSVEPISETDCPLSNTLEDTGFNKLNFSSDDVNWENLTNALNTHDWLSKVCSFPLKDMLAQITAVCFVTAEEYDHTNRGIESSQNHKIPMRAQNRIKKQLHVLKLTSDVGKSNLLQKAIEIEKKLKEQIVL